MKQSELKPQERVKKAAFTLAETMIVIIVLGIIATLTIPALVNKNKESIAKTKVRKAMAAYESALNKMIIENDLKSDDTLTAWAGANCVNSTNYFKKVQGDGCVFKTSDGIWWNISDIERPVISFKEINANNAAQITTNANNENDKTAFVLVGRFGNDGSLRVDDLAYETANSVNDANGNASKAQVEKLYNLLGLKSSSAGGGGNQSPFAACNGAETCVVGGITYTKMTLTAHTETYTYCDPEDWNFDLETCGEYDDKWKTGTSESETEDIYVAIEDNLIEWYNATNAKSEENCITSTYTDCSLYGDYYNLAKTHCESLGGSLAKIAQLTSLASQGKLPSGNFFWASASEDNGTYAYIVDYYGGIDYFGKNGNDGQVLCVGK